MSQEVITIALRSSLTNGIIIRTAFVKATSVSKYKTINFFS